MSSSPKNYFGLSSDYAAREEARVAIVPVPYEGGGGVHSGGKDGPRAILEASQHVELFDDELWTEPFKIGIHTADAVKIQAVDNQSKDPYGELVEAIKPFIDGNKFPIIIGGEHSISLGGVKGCIDKFADLSVLQINAHCDLRASYEGNEFGHASTGHQIYKALPRPLITQVGVRNISWEEVAWMEEEEPDINIFWARNQNKWDCNEIINTLSDNIYLSINVNAFDCSIMPATANPEPGGIDWYQMMELIKLACVRKNVVCADVTDLSPIKGMVAPNFVAAKLIYKLIGYRFALDLGVTKKYL